MSSQAIHEEALEAADAAFKLAMIEHDPMGGECQAAWIVIRPARGDYVTFLKRKGWGQNGVYGGWELHVNTPEGYRGQNGAIKEAGVRAFAKVLNDNGIKAGVHTRLV